MGKKTAGREVILMLISKRPDHKIVFQRKSRSPFTKPSRCCCVTDLLFTPIQRISENAHFIKNKHYRGNNVNRNLRASNPNLVTWAKFVKST